MNWISAIVLKITLIISLLIGGSTTVVTAPQATTTVATIENTSSSTIVVDPTQPTQTIDTPVTLQQVSGNPSPIVLPPLVIEIPIATETPSAPVQSQPVQTNTPFVAASAPDVPTCVASSSLSLQIPKPTSNEVVVFGYYTTGCDLDKSASSGYTFKVQQNGGALFSPGGSQDFDVEDNGKTLRFVSDETYTASSTLTFVLTVGGITATSTLQI